MCRSYSSRSPPVIWWISVSCPFSTRLLRHDHANPLSARTSASSRGGPLVTTLGSAGITPPLWALAGTRQGVSRAGAKPARETRGGRGSGGVLAGEVHTAGGHVAGVLELGAETAGG